jgi:hypothetical protein
MHAAGAQQHRLVELECVGGGILGNVRVVERVVHERGDDRHA